jgi:hypothetical protein
VIGETLMMKLFPVVNILIQMVEVACYAILYRKIYNHQQEMLSNQGQMSFYVRNL